MRVDSLYGKDYRSHGLDPGLTVMIAVYLFSGRTGAFSHTDILLLSVSGEVSLRIARQSLIYKAV